MCIFSFCIQSTSSIYKYYIYVCFNNFLAGINALYLKSYLGYYIKDLLDLMKLSHSH